MNARPWEVDYDFEFTALPRRHPCVITSLHQFARGRGPIGGSEHARSRVIALLLAREPQMQRMHDRP
jgi:hypothetical protein